MLVYMDNTTEKSPWSSVSDDLRDPTISTDSTV